MLKILVSSDEQQVICLLYEYFVEKDNWPGTRTFHKIVDRNAIEKILKRKNPPVLIEKYQDSGVDYYRLTFYGLLVCQKAKKDLDMLLSYLSLLKELFNKNPEIRVMDSVTVEPMLKLSKEQSKRLAVLINLGHLWGIQASPGGTSLSLGGVPWAFGIPDDIEELAASTSPEEYLEKRFQREKERWKEIDKIYSQRPVYSKLGPWFSYNLNLWFLTYFVFLTYRKLISTMITIDIWFVMYTISKILEDVFKKRVPFFTSVKIIEKMMWGIITFLISVLVGILVVKIIL